jgi:cytoskeletal protein CcmA (bactofilin family)
MFSKTPTKGSGSALPALSELPRDLPSIITDAMRKPKAASFIAPNVVIEGVITGDCELQLDGVLRGEVRVSHLAVGETGSVEGSVTADSAEIRGRVVGTISARQIRLFGTAHVDGDLHQEQLSIENGAQFQGRSLKLPKSADPAPVEAQLDMARPSASES